MTIETDTWVKPFVEGGNSAIEDVRLNVADESQFVTQNDELENHLLQEFIKF